MHKIWTIDDIKLVVDKIANRWNYPCNIKIEISKRATKRMGAFFYKRNGKNIIPIKFVFAYTLINGTYSEQVVREVIIHEYLHYYCDLSTNKSNGHNKFFKECCIASGISDSTTFKYFNEENNNDTKYKYKIYCSKCKKMVCVRARKDAAKRKVNSYISKCCNGRLYCDNLM